MAHTFIPDVRSWGPVALTLHGRTRQQRYSRQADWQYIEKCAELDPNLQVAVRASGTPSRYLRPLRWQHEPRPTPALAA